MLLGFSALWSRIASTVVGQVAARPAEGFRHAVGSVFALGELASRAVHAIPTEWLVGGLLATGLLYALLFALLAFGYSMLYAAPERSGSRPT